MRTIFQNIALCVVWIVIPQGTSAQTLCPPGDAIPNPNAGTIIDAVNGALSEAGFELDAANQITNPLTGGKMKICYTPSFDNGATARYLVNPDLLVLALNKLAVSGPLSPAQAAGVRGVIVHESTHQDQWQNALAMWKTQACAGLDGTALTACHDCMDALIQCHAAQGSPCQETWGYLSQHAQLCIDLQDPELTPAEADAIREMMNEVCAAALSNGVACLDPTLGCVNTCGNMAPMPPPPSAPTSACDCFA